MTQALRRAGLAWLAILAAEVVLLAGLGAALSVPLRLLDTALLLGSTTLLGSVWALRDHLTGKGRPALIAGLMPPAATALFLSPRLAQGAPSDALLTVAVSLAMAAPFERAWTEWVLARRPAALAYGLRVAGPAIAVALSALAVDRSALVGAGALAGALGGLGLAAWVTRRAARTEREALELAARVARVEVLADSLEIPAGPTPQDPWLAALVHSLRRRSEELAEDADRARRAEYDIDDARQLRSRFMASMSHDLRSPLNSIVGFAQILESGIDGELGEPQRQSVSLIRRSAEELIILLTDTLDLARLEAGKLKLDREWVPSVEILTEAVRRGRALVAGRDVEIEAELQPGLPPVHVDAARIVQAVVALFRHAAASMHRSKVRLRARTALGPPGPERQLRVEFYDAVGALPSDEVERIFEAFQEITAPAGRRLGGLGMALSLSRSLVRLHGGEVWADVAPGAGTVLCVALPLDVSEARP